ncbi:unknown protein [Desulfotalea psychrophila LSv54]|uniref:Uncharacterized protein n=1 Tax=Desulfotalea psychrophila (strain LSv54 / DSM 12343) TaxID=177439 RepID=Q6AK31_DESPS|nr:unknown protein [Desulfotalea psychrophila LSv54]
MRGRAIYRCIKPETPKKETIYKCIKAETPKKETIYICRQAKYLRRWPIYGQTVNQASRPSIEFPRFDGGHRIVACQPYWPKGEAFPPLHPMPLRPSCQSSLSFQLSLRLRTGSWTPLASAHAPHSVRATERGEGPPPSSYGRMQNVEMTMLSSVPMGIAQANIGAI